MSHRYSTALSHLILAGTGIYYLHVYTESFGLPCVTYGIIVTHSLLGVWRWGNPDYGDKVEGIYNFTFFLQMITCLPFITSQFFANVGFPREVAALFAGSALLPLSLYLADKPKEDVIDSIIACSGISMGIASFLYERFYGIAASLSYLFNHFVLREGQIDMDIPMLDLYNYGLCFYCCFAFKCL
ncbi:hypothetical protein FQA39_LY05061 [Lamprigera yunnana]|nr:hypothetical protein FQA39_LY05061 [Lamprigera yunnana]